MARKADRDLVCGNHHGQRPKRRANRPNTRLHPTTTPNLMSALAMREPSTQDLPKVAEESNLADSARKIPCKLG